MRVRPWYWKALLIWLLFALPVGVLGYGFSGGNISFDLSYLDPISIALTLIAWAAMAAPLLMLPFALERRR